MAEQDVLDFHIHKFYFYLKSFYNHKQIKIRTKGLTDKIIPRNEMLVVWHLNCDMV